MTYGQMKVTNCNNESVEGTDHDGVEFKQPALRDARGDAHVCLNDTEWYAKEFLTTFQIIIPR
jgi:hypothetical protein